MGPRIPSFASGGPAGVDLPALLLGALVVAAFGFASSGGGVPGLDEWGSAVLVALPAFLAGIMGARSVRGAARTLVWVVAGAVVGLVVFVVLVMASDPAAGDWESLVVLALLLVGPPALLAYGAGALVALGVTGRLGESVATARRGLAAIAWRRHLDEGARLAPFLLAAIVTVALGPTMLVGTRAWFAEAPMLLSVLLAVVLLGAGYETVTRRRSP